MNRHLTDQFQQQRLHQQREVAARSCPGNGHQPDAAGTTGDTRHTSADECLMLEHVEMPPFLLNRVVHRTIGYLALRTAEPRYSREIDAQAQHPLARVELRALDLSGRTQTEGDGEERVGVHADTVSRQLDRQLPTDLGKEPQKTLQGVSLQGCIWRAGVDSNH